jgi:hypothetical protein
MAVPILELANCITSDDGVRISLQNILPFLESVWNFRYDGPVVERSVELCGLRIWRRRYALSPEDSASADLIEDTWYRTYRPRWYELNLWSCALRSDQLIMRSNDQQSLAHLVELFNRTIKDVCDKTASSHC